MLLYIDQNTLLASGDTTCGAEFRGGLHAGGSNYGDEALTGARLWPEAVVIAVEPNPLLCRQQLPKG